MAKFVPLSRSRHAGKSWKRPESYGFASKESAVPVIGRELSMAAVNMPLGFIKDGENYRLYALLSFRQGDNLFTRADGRWAGSYVPALFRSYPFRLLRREGSKKMLLCIDEESDLIQDAGGNEPMFGPTGELSKSIKQVADFLEKVEISRVGTDLAVKALAKAGAIVPWDIKVRDGKRQVPLKGIFRVDEKKLNELEDPTFLGLRKAGAVAVAYAQMVSVSRLEMLSTLIRYRQESDSKAAQKAPNLDFLYERQDDQLKFD